MSSPCSHSRGEESVTVSHQNTQLLTSHGLGYIHGRAGESKVKCWGARRKQGAVHFALFPLKRVGGEILNPFYLAYDPEGWFL